MGCLLYGYEYLIKTQKTAPPVYKCPGRTVFVYLLIYLFRMAYIFGTTEAKDKAADGAEEEQHKAKADAVVKCFGQFKGLY